MNTLRYRKEVTGLPKLISVFVDDKEVFFGSRADFNNDFDYLLDYEIVSENNFFEANVYRLKSAIK